MDAAAAEMKVEAAAAATEMEEGAEARFGVETVAEMEKPEVPRGCGGDMTLVCPPYPFGAGKIAYYPGGDGPPHSPGSSSL